MEKILIIGGCGYIGSRLFQYLSKKKYSVDTVDTEWFGNYVNKNNIKEDYGNIKKNFISKYDAIILLAGYSSVLMCEGRMIESFKNNVGKFIRLLSKLRNQKFIYASSSSVYGNTEDREVDETYERYSPKNYYDLTKKEIDYYAQLSSVRYYGLRLGTVNGFSPNLRVDLMINKMYSDAQKTNRITIYNPNIFRPILGIEDLCKAIDVILKKDEPRGLYNMASFNNTIQEIADKISRCLRNISVVQKGNSQSYNFSVSTKKFQKTFDFKFQDTIESLVNSLVKDYNNSHKSIRENFYEKGKKMQILQKK